MKTFIYIASISAVLLSFSSEPDQTKNPPVFANVLTPNGDGKNDTFTIENLDQYPDNELSVFSRWGNEVYQSSPYRGDWIGNCTSCKKQSDSLLPSGTYYYIFTDKQTDTKYNGFLQLLR